MTSTAMPKQDRSRITRQRLLEATVLCLAEEGWQSATVSAVSARAGISRGAAQHHFPTREDLILAALDYMFERRSALADGALPVEGTGTEQIEAIVQLFAEQYTGTLFRAALQVWTVAAADQTLRERIIPLERKFGRDMHRMAVRLLDVDDSDPAIRGLIQGTLDMARGLGLADTLRDDSHRRAHVVAAWSAQLASALGRA